MPGLLRQRADNKNVLIMFPSGKDDTRVIVGTVEDEDSGCGACVEVFLLILSMILIIFTFPLSLFVTMKQVQEYERAVIFRLGKVKKGGAVGPGLFFIIPCLDTIQTVDLRTITFDVPPQEILTKDSV